MSPYRNYSSLLLMKKMEGIMRKKRREGGMEKKGGEKERKRKERKQLQATDKNPCSQTGACLVGCSLLIPPQKTMS